MGARAAVLAACAVVWPALAAGQERVAGEPRGLVNISFGTGLSAGSSQSGAAFTAGLERRLIGRLSLEVAGAYLDRGTAAEAWTGGAGLLLDLAPTSDRAVPYFAMGAGVYRARFEVFGPGTFATEVPPASPPRSAADTGPCPYASMPRFYQRRLGPLPAGGWPEERTFTDAVIALGGGVRWDASRRLFLRPDARALLVMGDGDTEVVGGFTLSVGYRF